MTSRVAQLENIITPDLLATRITELFQEWDMRRQLWKNDREEVMRYVYATDTTTTTNSKLPWNHQTPLLQLCQIRDTLHANYMAAIFPRRKWLYWEADEADSNSKEKRDSIVNYMSWVISQETFKNTVSSLLFDYIDNGNCFATAEWVDDTITLEDKQQVGYVGPVAKRFSPYDTLMNPVATNFRNAPKIIRSLVTLVEFKEILEAETTPEKAEAYKELWTYLKDQRAMVGNSNVGVGELEVQDAFMQIDGFHNYRAYLES